MTEDEREALEYGLLVGRLALPYLTPKEVKFEDWLKGDGMSDTLRSALERINRYEWSMGDDDDPDPTPEFYVDPFGDWVKWTDVADLLRAQATSDTPKGDA